jgi:hypothetical protein
MYIVHITDKHLEYRLYKYVYNPISATSGQEHHQNQG